VSGKIAAPRHGGENCGKVVVCVVKWWAICVVGLRSIGWLVTRGLDLVLITFLVVLLYS
jgi:hypothetical protein